VISLSQRPLPDNTQHSQQKNIHAPLGIRTHDLSRRAVADLRLRARGHWDRQAICTYIIQILVYLTERLCASIRRSIGEWCVGKREMLIVRDHTEHTLCAKHSTLVMNLAVRIASAVLGFLRNFSLRIINLAAFKITALLFIT